MKIKWIGAIGFWIILSYLQFAIAADTDNHTVTVTVNTINEIAVTGGNVLLTINTATAGSEPTNAADATSGLLWTSNASGKKITIGTNLASPEYTLKALATGVSGGTAASEVTVSNISQDFITGVSTTTGSSSTRYTASATVEGGAGSDIHTITFTIVDN
ncbi:hypothetical protein KKG66_02585 [bacterium]|nr:hypothetical protein [bacterium]